MDGCTIKDIGKTIACWLLSALSLCMAACEQKESPPFFKAMVEDIWHQETEVENFKILYWWEERGETPFLKPYFYHAKELILELFVPVGENSHRVSIVTRRIPLQDIERFFFLRNGIDNKITVRLKNGTEVVATDSFPKILKKESKAGFADYKIFLEGIIMKDKKREHFKIALDRVKQVQMLATLFEHQ